MRSNTPGGWTLIVLKGADRPALTLHFDVHPLLAPTVVPLLLFCLGGVVGVGWGTPQAAADHRPAKSHSPDAQSAYTDATPLGPRRDLPSEGDPESPADEVQARAAVGFEVDPAPSDPSSMEPFDTSESARRCSGRLVPDTEGLRRRVALTFDDGPDLDSTPRIIEILRDRETPATFFVNGAAATTAAHRKLLEELRDDPLFIVGSHGWSHQNLEGAERELLLDEVRLNGELLSGMGIDTSYFRFPFGRADCEETRFVARKGYVVVGWHVNSADWCYADHDGFCSEKRHRWVPEELRNDMAGYVLRQLEKHDGGIVLFHDRLAFTADQLVSVLDAIETAGFSIVRLDEEEVFPKLNKRRRARASELEKGKDDVRQEG